MVVLHCLFLDGARPSAPEAPEGQPSERKAGVTYKSRESPRRSLGLESRFPLTMQTTAFLAVVFAL